MARWFRDRSPRHGIPSVSLRQLLPDARFQGCRDLEVSGCSTDSRRLEPGEVFVALRGSRRDGHQFATRALERGAAALVVERPCADGGPLQVIVPDSGLAHARLTHALAGAPSDRMPVIAVAGTIGRTPTAHYLRGIFAAAGRRYGQIGVLGWTDGRNDRPHGPAEPGCDSLAEMLAALAEDGCDGVILEVSPDQLRRRVTSALNLESVVLTDISARPRADLKALEATRRDHARLVNRVKPGGWTVVNSSDRSAELLGATNLQTRRLSFGIDERSDVSARWTHIDHDAVRLVVTGFGSEVRAVLTRAGSRDVSHALAAAAYGLAHGLDAGVIAEGLESVTRPPGFLDPVREGQPFDVWIDRAASEAELISAIEQVRPQSDGRLICVLTTPDVGSLSTRLAQTCESLADQVVLTLDRPWKLEPNATLDDALARFQRPGHVRAEIDRGRAIEAALDIAEPGDAVLITGGRSQSVRIFDEKPIAQNDHTIATRHLRRHHQIAPRRSA